MRIEIEPGIRLYVDVHNSGLVPDGPRLRQLPTLLCLHGGPGFDHSGFRPYMGELTDVAQIVYYDHRGHGRSDPRPPDEWQLDVWADDVVRLCDAMGIEQPIVLGQSFGGFVAQRYLARHPDHPRKVILSATSHHFGLERKVAGFAKRGGVEAGRLTQAFWDTPSPQTWQAYWEGCRALYNTTLPRDPEAGARTLMREEILLHFVAGEMRTMDLLQGLDRTPCPVLVLAGSEDPVCPPEDAREIAAVLPTNQARYVEFPNVGHGPWRDDPQAAFAVLRGFIAGS